MPKSRKHMVEPTIDDLLETIPSKYKLVCLAAKRARELTEGAPAGVPDEGDKPTTIALKEIQAKKIGFVQPETR
ncbi:MAG: DNA-directed RNA polymerase subunit omega [Veillonellaceae bacterium]|nr:DNA-directed RNA polymerase subunit omega [Veillonellaceae bacterium]